MLFATYCWGNNLQLGKKVEVTDIREGAATLVLDVSWDNSWSDGYNNDGVWLFFKWRTARSEWAHVTIGSTVTASDGFTAFSAKNGNTVVGAILYRTAAGSGKSSTTLRVEWAYPAGVTAEMVKNGEVSIMSHGIEMVYVPFGNFMVGDGSSESGFTPIKIAGEGALSLSGGSSATLNGTYPKGYNGYYSMKYELSQEQYAMFVNSQSRAQQLKLLPQLQSLKKGDKIFGGASYLLIKEIMTETKPAVVGFSGNKGATIAAGYMSPSDMMTYACWSGLRPMSELEYEKGCRRSAPLHVVPEEYAWGNIILNPLTGVSDEGLSKEKPLGGNANGGSTPFTSPVRCGAFAAIGSNRATSGATFSGLMEMSGNVRELCVNVTASAFSRDVHGAGDVGRSPFFGLTAASAFGLRGGGFDSPAERLRVSDRKEATGFFDILSKRDASVGFRLVRSLDGDAVKLNPGTIEGDSTYCQGESFVIIGVTNASVSGVGGMDIRYEWYLDGGKITGASGNSLQYATGMHNVPAAGDKRYSFTRRAVGPIGFAESNSVTVIVRGRMVLKVEPQVTHVTSLTSDVVVASGERTGSVTWILQGTPETIISGPTNIGVSTPVSYKPVYKDFKDTPGDYTIIVRSKTTEGCSEEQTLKAEVRVRILAGKLTAPDAICLGEPLIVKGTPASLEGISGVVPTYSWYLDGTLVSDATKQNITYTGSLKGNREYSVFRRATAADGSYGDSDTVKVNVKRCMPTRPDGTDYKTVTVDTMEWFAENLQTPTSVGNTWDNGEYGLLYNFDAAMAACPVGWHLPTNEEWGIWAATYGSTDLGVHMKTPTGWQSAVYPGDNTTGFSGTPGGYITSSGVPQKKNTDGYWWTCTSSGSGTSANIRVLQSRSTGMPVVSPLAKANGLSVRCVRTE